VAKLPDEFKRGFSIFFVRNIDQVYKVCFDTEETRLEDGSADEELRQAGIEVERYEDDTLMNNKLLTEEENLMISTVKHNYLEDL
jgi:hypothetical protein